MKKTVLVVDDSAMMIKIISKAISLSPHLEVVGKAHDAYEARELILKYKPDLVTLDLQLPEIDGLSFLETLMSHLPQKVVVISSFTKKGSNAALKAYELGAIDVIEKPEAASLRTDEAIKSALTERIESAAMARFQKKRPSMPAPQVANEQHYHVNQTIAVASSTGGTEALKVFLAGFGRSSPPIVIAQHMTSHFTKLFAENLAKILPLRVFEGAEGQKIECNTVYLAPGDHHMEVRKSGGLLQIHLHQEPPLHNVRPAADYLLKSVAKAIGPTATGVVLTGMGRDGAQGLLEMKKAGGFTLAQSEETCVVFGMPQAALALGAPAQMLDLDKIAPTILRKLKSSQAA